MYASGTAVNRIQKLPLWYYDTKRHRWAPTDSPASHHRQPYQQQSLRVVTYNVWFSRAHQPLRLNSLNTLLQHSNANIICLQEMTRWVLHELLSQPWVQNRYLLSDIDGRTFATSSSSYGVVMFIDKRLSVQQLLAVPFPTKQGRQLLLAEIRLRNELLHIGTVHLESIRRNAEFRSEQLQICQSIFSELAAHRPRVTQLLVGDFNFDSHWPENAAHMNILAKWADLWPSLHGPHDPGLTMNEVRLDRMMFRSPRVTPTAIRIIGNRPIGKVPKRGISAMDILNFLSLRSEEELMEYVYTSDHFGLMADFSLRRI